MKTHAGNSALHLLLALALTGVLFAQNSNADNSLTESNNLVHYWSHLLRQRSGPGPKETESLYLAVKILKEVPVDGRGFPGGAQSRQAALEALKHFNALGEYERKLKAYYKEDKSNETYDRLMVECLPLSKSEDETPYLERLHETYPDDYGLGIELARSYNRQGNDEALFPLVEALLATNFDGTMIAQITDPVQLFTRHHQIPELVKMYDNARAASKGPLTEFTRSRILPLMQSDTKQEEIARAKTLLEHDDRQGSWADRGQLIQLLADVGDKEGVGEQCEQLFFSDDHPVMLQGLNRLPANSQLPGLWSWDSQDVPYAPGLDVIRAARAAGQIERLEKRARSEIAAHPEDEFLPELLLMIMVFGHDPEAFTLLPDYLKTRIAEAKPGQWILYFQPVYAMFGEMQRWPEAKGYLNSTLEAAFQIQTKSLPDGFFLDR